MESKKKKEIEESKLKGGGKKLHTKSGSLPTSFGYVVMLLIMHLFGSF